MRKGQSLVEVLIGIAIGAIFVIGAALIIAPSLQIGKQTTQVQVKTELADEMLSNVKAWAAGNWNGVLGLATGTANPYYLNTSSSPFTILTGSGTIVTVTSTATIAWVQSTSSAPFGVTAATKQFGSNVAKGDLIIVGTYNVPGDVITATDTLNDTFTRVAISSNFDHDADILIATTSAAGADKVTVKDANPGGLYGLSIHEYSGTATGSIASIMDSSSTNSSVGSAILSTGNVTSTMNGDLIFAYFVNGTDGVNTFGYSSDYHARELVFAPANFCGATANCLASEDRILASAGDASPTSSMANSDNWVAIAIAIKPGLITSTTTVAGGNASGTQSVGQTIVGGNVTYTRYFYLSDVYRDANGNVTTTASGNNYDPSTKLVTIVVQSSSTPATPTFTFSQYLTRNGSNNITQSSWAGGAGQSNPVTIVGTNYAAAANVTITGSGAIQLSSGGGSCIQ